MTLFEQHKQRCPWLLKTGMCSANTESNLNCAEDFCAPLYWIKKTTKRTERKYPMSALTEDH